MTKEELIKTGEYILTSAHKKDVFNIRSIDDVVNKDNAEIVKKWCKDIELFLINVKNDTVVNMIKDNSWILNNNRISVTRIQNIIDILKEYKDN